MSKLLNMQSKSHRIMMNSDTEENSSDSTIEAVNVENESSGKRKRSSEEEEVEKSRHCELCGGKNDGKPPPHMATVVDLKELHDGFGHEEGWLGRLICPITYRPRICIHYQCLIWTPEVHLTESESWQNVESALARGKSLKCTHCRRKGATLGCRIEHCCRTYHLACARFNGCKFDHKEFLMACPNHASMFQQQQPHRHNRDKGKNQISGSDNDDEDDGGKHKKFKNTVPIFVGGNEKDSENDKYSSMGGWESVGGLQKVIQCMKEVVLLPMLYPEFFNSYSITPPRGVLLHGYPGTGKTHVVRALVASCSRGDKRIAYFSCKGADCLSKYVGDSEKHLKRLFEAAEECQPSIIFFDEIDGLAPSRTHESDQTHTSVVTTLLSLLDGIKSRGSVVVIGATNRPNAIDPALRRPGRFDREVYFPLPSLEDRISIISVYTQKWPKPPKPDVVAWVGAKTGGFAGADLKALCTETVMTALRRKFPIKEALSKVDDISNKRVDLGVGRKVLVVEERDWLEALSKVPPPCSRRDSSSADVYEIGVRLPSHLLACLVGPLSTLLVSLYMEESIGLPNNLLKAATVIKRNTISTLKNNSNKWWVHVDELIHENTKMRKQITKEIDREWDEKEKEDCDLIVEDSEDDDDHNCNEKREFILEKSDGFGVIIAGNPRSGQNHLASCILNGYREHIEIRKLNLVTLVSNQRFGSLGQAMAITMCDFESRGSCLIFMPMIESWAIDHHHDSDDPTPSPVWNIFSQQAHSLSSQSTPFIFLATSDIPFLLLPRAIRKFFGNDLSNCKLAGKRKNRIPRFSIQVDNNFNLSLVMEQSATKICKHLLKLIVQFIQQHHNGITRSEDEDRRRKFEEANRSLVSEAISSFGKEILQNSEFGIVTSKFKLQESVPSASISESEWKEYKFKSCEVVRDENNKDVVTVKGLIAVGLLAKKGVYTSVEQVRCDVKGIINVLEEKVNAKVDAGKNKVQYYRVLSQGSWLRDVVDNWAHYYNQKSLKLKEEERVEEERAMKECDVICRMNCCRGCVDILHVVIRKIIRNEFGISSSTKTFDGTIEGVNEIVMSKWLKIASNLTKSFITNVVHLEQQEEEEKYKKLVESCGMESCDCKINNNMMEIAECRRHIGLGTRTNTSNTDIENKFVFKNNVLVAGVNVDEEQEQIVRCCDYHSICLGSFIHLIANHNKKQQP